MKPHPFMAGLVSVGFLADPAVAAKLNYEMIWEVPHSPGANSVAHVNGRAYVASGTTLHALDLKTKASVGTVDHRHGRFR